MTKGFFLKDKKEMKEQLIKKKKTIFLRERKNENICLYAVVSRPHGSIGTYIY
jgi:hypothetical protein